MTSNNLILAVGAAIIITIFVTSFLQHTPNSFSKIITVGPLWTTNTWSCTSNADYVVHGALRGLEGSSLAISISGLGTQSLYALDSDKLESFTIGAKSGETVIITRTGIVTGWLTLQTMSDANATCNQAK